MAGKSDSPPPLPNEVVMRVLRVASVDAYVLLVLAGLFALAAASAREIPGAIAGCAAAGAGAIELHGVHLLRDGFSRGLRLIVRSQIVLLAAVLGYVAWRILHIEAVIQQVDTRELETRLIQSGVPEESLQEFIRQGFTMIYTLIGLVSILYQGGMALYFLRRREAVDLVCRAEE